MDALILSAVRTPIGKFLGGLSELSAPGLGAIAVTEAVKRTGAKPEQFDEVILGNVVQAGVGQAPARQAALAAGLPDAIAAVTINKVCGSGLKAVMLAAQAIKAGDADLIVAGGMESMSNAPHLLLGSRRGHKYGDQTMTDALIRDGLWCAMEHCAMGDSADYIAAKCEVSREEQDRFSARSHQLAAAAWERGDFAAEIVPVNLPASGGRKTAVAISKDEGIRPESTKEGLAKLRPAFSPTGTVTAGNASQLSDGAAACVVASRSAAEKLGAEPLARILSYATSGVAPKDIFIAPVAAMNMALQKAGLTLQDMGLIELNEAFAAQMLACGKGLKWDEAKVNVNGGGIALGHPIGASGARILATLVHALRKRGAKYGLASLCLGGGNAVAMVVEALETKNGR